MATQQVQIDGPRLAEICRRHHVARLSLFGSVLTHQFGPESDVDMLVEFERGRPITYFDVVALEMELSNLIGRKVDVRTRAELSRYFRDRVVREAQVAYAA